jgi:hypothetical protein
MRTLSPSLLLLTLGLVAGCATRAPVLKGVPAFELPVAVYRAKLHDPVDGGRRFRLWLYASLPDRLHGEILSPVGTTEVIVDAGAGRMAVAFVRDRVAFVGGADPDVLEGLLGVRVGLEELVRALLIAGEGPRGYRVERAPGAAGGLPERIRFESDGRVLELELKRRQALPDKAPELGLGVAPAGMTEHPLEQLDAAALREPGAGGSGE